MPGSIFTQESRPHFIEQLLDAATIFECPFEDWDHGRRHIETTPTALISESKQVIGVLFSTGAGPTIGSDAGFTYLGQ
jgi:hypothetical protein